MKDAKIPLIYRPILEYDNEYRFMVFYGGRGGGKSENIGQSLVILSLTRKLRILCIREAQSSLAESVKSLIEKWILELDLSNYFRITNTTITCLKTKSEFLFMGMKSHTAINVKSINNVDITWIEEAEAFSERSWGLLVPSVTRTPNPKIIISFNPYKEDDTIYKEFIVNQPPKNSLIVKVNYMDNPFFANTYLEQLRQDDEQRLPAEVYKHRWLGEILTNIESSLFKNVDFTPMEISRIKFIKKIIACDPATTNKDHSNEYGIIVLGKTQEGLIIILDDYSGKYTPLEFATQVNKASKDFNTNKIIVETNQGGDFIKSILVSVNPYLQVCEVRATSSKNDRALPVANLMEIRKVIFGNTLLQLKRQLELMTNLGYLGLKGESPDRADAMIWGVYHLANIIDKDSIYTVFSPDWFILDNEFIEYSRCFCKSATYILPYQGEFICIQIRILKNNNIFKILILNSYKTENLDSIQDSIKIIKNIPLVDNITSKYNLNSYEVIKKDKLDEKVLSVLHLCKQNYIMIGQSENEFNNNYGNLLSIDLMEFKLEADKDFPFVDLFCDIIFTEFQLFKE